MEEFTSEVTVSQHERFAALWNWLSSDGTFDGTIDVDNGDGSMGLAIVTQKVEDINPQHEDPRIVAFNRAPDNQVIECVTRKDGKDKFTRLGKTWITVAGGQNPRHAEQLDTLERIIFSAAQIGIDEIPGIVPDDL